MDEAVTVHSPVSVRTPNGAHPTSTRPQQSRRHEAQSQTNRAKCPDPVPRANPRGSTRWNDPSVRSTGVAGRLVDTAATPAAGASTRKIYYWVSAENGRAVGFATGFGFRVTSQTPAITGDPTLGDTEIALVLPLEHPHTIPNSTSGRSPRP
jgi:hypothetical protein